MKSIDAFTYLVKINLCFEKFNKHFMHKHGISLVQWSILKHLMDLPATSAVDLALATQTHPSSLTQSLKVLLEKGWLVIAKDPKDSRKKIISITRDGVTVVRNLDQLIRDNYSDIELLCESLRTVDLKLREGFNLL